MKGLSGKNIVGVYCDVLLDIIEWPTDGWIDPDGVILVEELMDSQRKYTNHPILFHFC